MSDYSVPSHLNCALTRLPHYAPVTVDLLGENLYSDLQTPDHPVLGPYIRGISAMGPYPDPVRVLLVSGTHVPPSWLVGPTRVGFSANGPTILVDVDTMSPSVASAARNSIDPAEAGARDGLSLLLAQTGRPDPFDLTGGRRPAGRREMMVTAARDLLTTYFVRARVAADMGARADVSVIRMSRTDVENTTRRAMLRFVAESLDATGQFAEGRTDEDGLSAAVLRHARDAMAVPVTLAAQRPLVATALSGPLFRQFFGAFWPDLAERLTAFPTAILPSRLHVADTVNGLVPLIDQFLRTVSWEWRMSERDWVLMPVRSGK